MPERPPLLFPTAPRSCPLPAPPSLPAAYLIAQALANRLIGPSLAPRTGPGGHSNGSAHKYVPLGVGGFLTGAELELAEMEEGGGVLLASDRAGGATHIRGGKD